MGPVIECATCHRPVTEADAAFCPRCGAPLPAPVTVPLGAPEPPLAPAALESPPMPEAMPPEPPATPPEPAGDNRQAALLAVVSAGLAAVGAFQVWLRIRIAGFSPPGGAETGWKGGDGRTIVVAALISTGAAIALVLGRRELWVKVALLVAGGVTAIIAIVNMVDASSKAHDIQVRFGVPSGEVTAQLGVGLFLVAAGGLGILIAGLRARTAPQ